MKWSIIFSVIAMILYSSEVVTTDLKLSKMNPWNMTFLYGLGTAIVSIPFVYWYSGSGPETIVSWPSRPNEWGYVLLVCLFAAGGAWANFSALHHEAGAVVLCTVYMLLPVAAALIMAALGHHGFPSWRLMLAWALAGVALYLVGVDSAHSSNI